MRQGPGSRWCYLRYFLLPTAIAASTAHSQYTNRSLRMTPILILVLGLGSSHAVSGLSARSDILNLFFEILRWAHIEDDAVCRTHECRRAAEDISDGLDLSVDPCDDFYGFACNGWIDTHPIPKVATHWNQFNVLNDRLDSRLRTILSEGVRPDDEDVVKATKMVYEACMDEERIEEMGVQPLLDFLDELNGWPLISRASYNSSAHWQDTAVLVNREVGIAPVLHVNVDVDLRNTSRNVIVVEQPPSPVSVFYFLDKSFQQQYASYLTKVAQLLMKKRLSAYSSTSQRQIRKITQFAKALAILTKEKSEVRVLDEHHNEVTVKELQQWTDNATSYIRSSPVNWKRYLQELLSKGPSEINDETTVVVSDWDFLRDLFQLIENTQQETVVNYMIWEVVKLMARNVNRKMRRLDFQFKNAVAGVEEDVPRWQECVQATGDVSFAIGYMYVRRYFSNEAKAKAISIVDNIREEFRKELSQVKWIDEDTKHAALEKADHMNHFIGYPNWYENGTALNEYYKGLTIGRDHFANTLAIRRFLTRKHLEKLEKTATRDEWPLGPAIINAFYDVSRNSIIVPAGILEAPFFSNDQPDALNYGSIGVIIGHEITHAFDVVGRQVDAFGTIHQWWTKDTERTYLENAKCFIDEYSKFRFPDVEDDETGQVHLDGVLTLGENIADNGGMATALKAYLKHSKNRDVKLPGLEEYTADQLFYLGFARTWCETTSKASLLGEVMEGTHSPHSVRVTGTVANSKHFAETWGCKRGSKMNPKKKCQLW